MANYVYIGITVTSSDPARLEAFAEAVRLESLGKTLPFSFHKILPIPQELLDTSYPNLKAGAYDWMIENWAVREDVVRGEISSQSVDSIVYQLETPWDFPEPVIRKMVELFPDLSFSGYASEECDEFELDFSYSPGGELVIEPFDREQELVDELAQQLSAEPQHVWF